MPTSNSTATRTRSKASARKCSLRLREDQRDRALYATLGTYTRYGDVFPLLTAVDDKLAVFGSGDEVRLDFDPSDCRHCRRAGCVIISSLRTATKKIWTSTPRKGLCRTPAVPQHGRISVLIQEGFPAGRRTPEIPARIQHAAHVRQRAAGILVRLWQESQPENGVYSAFAAVLAT